MLTRVVGGSTGCPICFLTVTWSPSMGHRQSMRGDTSLELRRSSLSHMKRGTILINPGQPYGGRWSNFTCIGGDVYLWISSEQRPCLLPHRLLAAWPKLGISVPTAGKVPAGFSVRTIKWRLPWRSVFGLPAEKSLCSRLVHPLIHSADNKQILS